MNRVPDSELIYIPGGTLITATPEEGRPLAFPIAPTRFTTFNRIWTCSKPVGLLMRSIQTA